MFTQWCFRLCTCIIQVVLAARQVARKNQVHMSQRATTTVGKPGRTNPSRKVASTQRRLLQISARARPTRLELSPHVAALKRSILTLCLLSAQHTLYVHPIFRFWIRICVPSNNPVPRFSHLLLIVLPWLIAVHRERGIL